MEITVILVWMACLLSYLTSNNQRILPQPFNKKIGWIGFVLLLVIAQMASMQSYAFAAALLVNLSLVMMSWILIIVLHAHQGLTKLPLWFTGVLLVSFFVRFGGNYVV